MREGRLVAALCVSVAVAAVEVIGGVRAQSIGLVADAVHAATDALAIAVTLVASHLSHRRVEIFGAAFNAVLLLGITAFVAYGAVQRLLHPLHPHGGAMAAIAAVALCGNLLAGVLLLHGARKNIHTRSAFFNVGGDALGSFAVLVAGGLIVLTHRAWLDPAFSLVVCAIVLGGVVHMVRDGAGALRDAEAESAAPEKISP